MIEQISYCLELQDKFNAKLDPNWKDKRTHTDWALALWTELAEFLESLNWKWWKDTNVDYDNLALETVDFFHFCLSEMLLLNKNKSYIEIAKEIYSLVDSPTCITTNLTNLLYFASISIKLMTTCELNKHYESYDINVPFVISSFLIDTLTIMLDYSKINFSTLLNLYVYKNALNQLRQDYGYKSGVYKKLWDGKHEDNYFMMKLAKQSTTFKTFEDAYQELENEYKKYNNVRG